MSNALFYVHAATVVMLSAFAIAATSSGHYSMALAMMMIPLSFLFVRSVLVLQVFTIAVLMCLASDLELQVTTDEGETFNGATVILLLVLFAYVMALTRGLC